MQSTWDYTTSPVAWSYKQDRSFASFIIGPVGSGAEIIDQNFPQYQGVRLTSAEVLIHYRGATQNVDCPIEVIPAAGRFWIINPWMENLVALSKVDAGTIDMQSLTYTAKRWGFNMAKSVEPIVPKNMTLNEVIAYDGLRKAQFLAHQTASKAGWYKNPETGENIQRNFGEVVALMHSELSEALEADRKGLFDDKLPHRDGREVEFADCIIRILDTADALGLDLAGAFIEKNRFNKTRSDHKIENRAKGGKKY